MTSAEILADLKEKLGNTSFGLTDLQLYRSLNESKKWHERNTNISFKGDVGIKVASSSGTVTLSASTIDLSSNFSLIKIIDNSVIFDDNWDGRGVPPFIEKTTTQHIRLLRQTNDMTGDPQYYAVHRDIVTGSAVLKLELYPAMSAAQADITTSKLRCDILQLSPAISEDNASEEMLIPDYVEQAISYKSASDIKLSNGAINWMDLKVAWRIEMRDVRSESNNLCTGSVRQRLAQ